MIPRNGSLCPAARRAGGGHSVSRLSASPPTPRSRIALPGSIEIQLRRYLARHPSLSWDDALAQIIGGQNGLDVVV
jgi:hypothetical protein